MDTYTSAEFIHTRELLHYSHSFYAPFERLYEKAPDTMKLYHKAAVKISEIGNFAEAVFFGIKPARTVLLVMGMVLIGIIAGGVL